MSGDRIHPAAGRGFEVAVEHYERGRPGYPDDAVSYLVRELGIGEGRDVLELGAGTGKFTELIVHTGARITTVEPVVAMRAALERNCPTVSSTTTWPTPRCTRWPSAAWPTSPRTR